MASSCKRRICTDENRGVHQDFDAWRSKLIDCVGVEKIFKLLLGTRIFENSRKLKDYKPASVSNWSFDANCLFCCLRREKVKEHVIALNNKIVESGGKPLLGKDHCNIKRLESQVEEFLNAVLHRKEYIPRIPDPHIPVVACSTMQQMINHLVVHNTSNTNSQDSFQHNSIAQSLLKTHSSTSPIAVATPTAAASSQNPVLSRLLMEYQDAPLDLSVKKARPEIHEQDGVLDLSTKKNRSQDGMLLKSSPVNLTTPVVRQSTDSGFAVARDLQSSSSSSMLEQFMAKLCLHHQQQIVDAFGFLQSEIKAATSSSEVQVLTPPVPEKPLTPECPEGRAEVHAIEETLLLESNRHQELPVFKSKDVSSGEQPLKAEEPSVVSAIDLDQTDIEVDDDSGGDVECRSTDIQPKCPTLLIEKNDHGNLETKKVVAVGSIIQQQSTGALEQGPSTSDTLSHTQSIDHDTAVVSPCFTSHGPTDPKCLPVHINETSIKPGLVQRTTNVTLSNSSRTAKKSSRASQYRPRIGPSGNIVNDPDIKYDIVYVGKPITECRFESQNRMLPRKNARKSTRGHLCLGDCLEIKTVRTLAIKPPQNSHGNYPIPMPEITTSVTPKQAFAKPDGLPAMTVPFTGDCMETVMNRNVADQSVVTEIPGDVIEIPSEDLIVEPSQTGQTSSLRDEDCDSFVLQDSNVEIHNISDSSENTYNSTMANKTTEKIECTTKDASPSNMRLEGLETVDQAQNIATEALLNTESIEKDISEAEGLNIGSDLKNNLPLCDSLTESTDQTERQTKRLITCTDNSTILQICEPEESIKTVYSTSSDEDKIDSAVTNSVVEDITTREQCEECREGVSVNFGTAKSVAKHAPPSDRCLRSGATKALPEQTNISEMADQTKLADLALDTCEKNVLESKHSLTISKSKHTVEQVPSLDGQNNVDRPDDNTEKAQQSPVIMQIESIANKMCTRQNQKPMLVKELESGNEQKVQEFPNLNDELKGKHCGVDNTSDNVVPTTPDREESPVKNNHGLSITVSETMPLRDRGGQSECSVSRDSSSPVGNTLQTPIRMPLRSRNNNVDLPLDADSCSSLAVDALENLERMPLRSRNSGSAEQIVGYITPNTTSLDSAAHMPLRSRNSSAVKPHVTGGTSDMDKDTSSTSIEQYRDEGSGVTSKKSANTGHMPLRSGSGLTAEQSTSCSSFGCDASTVSESPGRMSLRRSNTLGAEKQDCLPTLSKSKKLSPKFMKISRTSVPSLIHKGECNNTQANIKTDKLFNAQMKVSSIPHSFNTSTPATASSLVLSPCKFLEALNGEGNQHLISYLNNKFDRMQKGWVQMDKEGQPAPKPKNRADRLKEIWKSKRRIRKPRSLEQQKFSPVQMLFMKSFDLPNICRWFLQTTETKSLVIVKKVNTRLPSETQLGFQTLPSVQESSGGIFPSLQAERLKKHLKKFAIASPVKSNPKNKRLIAKALAQGIYKEKEKREPRTATRISSKPQISTGLIQPQSIENHSKVAASAKNPTGAKNPASARILRKYSNMREKKQVQQNSLINLKKSIVKKDSSYSMTKNITKEKLSTKRESKVVKNLKQLAKKTKTPAAKEKLAKGGSRALKGLNDKGGISPKKVLQRVLKSNCVIAHKTVSKKETLVKTEKSPQTKTDHKKSPLHKGPESLISQSQTVDMKPLLSEDQVLTRSQRKMEATLAQTGSPKTSTKRGMETSLPSAKRTRTSK